ncbi:MAG: acetoacetate--CoA ligase [Gammaproteobacteria bacterium]|nr:acetoacetate--CoA ligase [Rhodocyclaceae bacterium]MBU3909911.1 acetoacetate--CoA ligase [Gammaproteobacteria bacterium]MBU3988937.1 acetoacetate--CoA ligase [Gammaproteobacteria bacterium]MBU4003510.1 acetoacetate--CoA ligase [Gammaproteobacteria bacterium]MBU4020131.1 acetoacetate--CoA ligase [Gammaproteobacteria bacterium]
MMWQPGAGRIAAANLSAFARQAAERFGRRAFFKGAHADYASLHRWSVDHPEEFWSLLWDFAKVRGEKGSVVLADGDKMPGAKWFPEARLNYAQNLLRRRDDGTALVFWGEDKQKRRIGRDDLYRRVARLAQAIKNEGVGPGDVVAAYMPNLPETLITMLAAASLGAVFTSASPDFGVQGVLDRFGQVAPKLLFVADGYFYNGKLLDSLGKVKDIVAGLPTVKKTIVTRYTHQEGHDLAAIPRAVMLRDFVDPYREQTEIEFAQLPFAHPLYILYSSGTTGVPKCIVHGAGGSLLQHLKEHRLQADIKAGDKVFYFTTCGWMMWNWLVSALASNATLLLYDGSPFVGRGNILFDYAAIEGMTHLGTSAKFIDACAKINLKPGVKHNLAALRAIFSTGSPLSPESFDYVYRDIKPDVQLASISGGTDIVSCFVLGNPVGPVWRGEIQCAGLGMAVEVLDEQGKRAAVGEKGELACLRSFPSMPISFWNDADGAKYRAAYFERFAGIWCHGDFAERTAHDGFIIHGRSDATLNPGGVRIGTAEIYRQVETLPEVVESLVIGQEFAGDVRVVLFVKLQEGLTLDEALAKRIKETIRANTTPRHVPDKVLQVADIPRTKSGKIVELAVREVVHGRAVKNSEALANPEALEQFRNRSELAA